MNYEREHVYHEFPTSHEHSHYPHDDVFRLPYDDYPALIRTTIFATTFLKTMTTTLTVSIAVSTMAFLAHLVIIILLTITNTTGVKGETVKSLKRIGMDIMGRTASIGLDARANVLKANAQKG